MNFYGFRVLLFLAQEHIQTHLRSAFNFLIGKLRPGDTLVALVWWPTQYNITDMVCRRAITTNKLTRACALQMLRCIWFDFARLHCKFVRCACASSKYININGGIWCWINNLYTLQHMDWCENGYLMYFIYKCSHKEVCAVFFVPI